VRLCRWQVSEHDEVEIRDPEENIEIAIDSKNLNGCSTIILYTECTNSCWLCV
jgi:hypothetical protein